MASQDLAGVQSAIEIACADFESPGRRQQGEAVLLQFRASRNPQAACRHIIEHSHSFQARFQAALALRESTLREWVMLAPEQRKALRSYALHYAIRHAGDAHGVMRSQLVGAVAAFLKRGWMEEGAEQRAAFFGEVEAAVASGGDAAIRRVGIQILEAVVVEFSPATASPMGMPWDFHERCRSSLEADYLPSFFAHGVRVARQAAPQAAEGGNRDVCAACASLLAAILSWEFQPPRGMLMSYGSGRPTSDTIAVRPGKSWRQLLLAPEVVDWIPQLRSACRHDGGTSLATSIHELVVLLCSLDGDVFPRSDAAQRQALGLAPGEDPKTLYLGRLLAVLLPWIHPPNQATAHADADDGYELTAACRALAAAAPVHRARGFAAACPPAEGLPGGALGAVAGLAQAVIAAGGCREAAQDSWAADATDLLLSAWVDLLQEELVGVRQPGLPPVPGIAAAAGGVFSALVHAALADAVEGAFEDEEEGEAAGESGAADAREEWLSRVAAVGRGDAAASLHLLTGLLRQKRADLHHCSAQGADPSRPLEELCWLLRASAHLLADAGEGETPMVPLPVEAAAEAAAAAQLPDPVVALSNEVLGVAGLSLDPNARSVCSPRLMEAACEAVARWAGTYLLSEDSVGPAIAAAYGPQGGGPEAMSALVRIAMTLLTTYEGEVDLHRVVVMRLLPVLVRRRGACRRVVQLPEWRQLAAAFAGAVPALRALAEPQQRWLARSLCLAAAGLPDENAASQYVHDLVTPIVGELTGLAGEGTLPQVAERPDVLRKVQALLETLRGVARGTAPRSQAPLFSILRVVMPALLHLQAVYRNDPQVTCLIIKLAADIVAAHVSFLKAGDAAALCEWVMAVLQQYSRTHAGQRSAAAAAAVRQGVAEDAHRDLRALLRLLTQLTQRDLLDFSSSDGGGPSVDVAGVVLLGLSILVPLMQGEMLQFPKLCRAYFRLLAHMLEVYPERVATLPGDQLTTLLSTLEYGVSTGDAEVTQSTLEALAALARFHLTAVTAGAQGFPSQAGGGSPLAPFLEVLLRRLLLEDTSRDTVDLAADALLPLILSHQHVFQHVGEKLLAGQEEAATRALLTRALTDLLASNGVTASVDRANRKRFRTNLGNFVSEARSIVRTC